MASVELFKKGGFMKKIISSLLLVSQVTFAHDIVSVKLPKNSVLKEFKTLAQKVKNQWIVVRAYHVNEVSPVVKGESKVDALLRVVKYSLHRDYPITGDDGGYTFDILTKESSNREIEKSFDYLSWLSNLEGKDLNFEGVKSFVHQAVKSHLIVFVGSGGGNNTGADIVVLVDAKNMEFVYLMESNFGSDS